MTRTGKVLAVLGTLAATTVVGWLLLIGAVYAIGGVATVRIEDRAQGLDLSLPVPMAVVDLAIASVAVPAVYSAGLSGLEVDGVRVELGELGPAVLGLLEELDHLPDATLVEVMDGRELVTISKEGGRLRLLVDSKDASFDLTIPTRAVRRLAHRLAG